MTGAFTTCDPGDETELPGTDRGDREMTHVVSFSGGIGSWYTAKIVVEEICHPNEVVVLLFADTMIEDRDTYKFLDAGAAALGLTVTRIADGRTPWELFKEQRFLGNPRVDLCSRVLKRELLNKWIRDRYTPSNCVTYVGIDWTEVHRIERLQARSHPWVFRAPLCEPSWRDVTRNDMHKAAKDAGLPKQRLYEAGLPHANCGGGCVKAGISHFMRLYEVLPERFAEWERNEQDVADHLGKNVTILRDRRGGKSRPMSLADLRKRIEGGDSSLPQHDWGGCGCAVE